MDTEGYGEPYKVEAIVDLSNPEHAAAVQDLERALGHGVLAGPVGEIQDTILTDDWFLDASRDIFDSEVPGMNVISLLRAERDRFTGLAIYRGEKTPYIIFRSQESGGSSLHPRINITDGHAFPSQSSLQSFIHNRIRELHPPFAMVYESPIKKNLQTNFRPGTSSITRDYLKEYVIHRRYNEHGLNNGALAELFNLLTHAVGLEVPQKELGTEETYDFVSPSDIEEALESAGVKYTPRKSATQKLEKVLYEQLRTGQPTEHGEVVAEGLLGINLVDQRVMPSQVARQSLVAVAKHFRRNSRMAPKLMEYAS